jgi:pimeloyl-ACP methyl ester carboxylesterase
VIPSPYATALAALPTDRRQDHVHGGTTRYWVYGADEAAPTIVLVHGFRGDHHGMEPIVAALPGCRLIVPDLPGFGESTPFDAGPHDVENYAAWLVELVHEVAGEDDPVLLGHSFGSLVVGAALRRGLSTPLAILVNPIAAPALEGPRGLLTRLAVFYYWLGARLPERLGLALLSSPGVVRGLSMLMAKTRDRGLRRWIHDQHHRYFSVFASRQVVLEAFRASVGSDLSQLAPGIAVPTLLIGGDQDDITSPKAHHQLQTLFGSAELTMIAGVGHLIHYEAPDQAANVIRRALERAGLAS